MYSFQGRFMYMEELTDENNKKLFVFLQKNSDDYERLVFRKKIPSTFEDFVSRMNICFLNGRKNQFLIFNYNRAELIGTAYFYHHVGNSIKMSVFFSSRYRNSRMVAESLGALMLFAKNMLEIKKVLFSIYSSNIKMISFAKKIGANATNNSNGVVGYEIDSGFFSTVESKMNKLYR